MKTTKIFGPPGTGKTTALIKILEDEIASGTKPDKIAYVTFSVSARQEALGRAMDKIPGAKEKEFKHFRTIHGICYNEIGMISSCLMQVEDYMKFAKYCPIEFSDNFTTDYDIDGLPFGYSTSPGNRILNIRQVASARDIDPFSQECVESDWPKDMKRSEVEYVLKKYQAYKSDFGKYDFVDLLNIYRETGEAIDVDAAFIDEAQDLSRLQWLLIGKMFSRCKRLYIAGDDDQSIYQFLGSDPFGFYDYNCDDKLVLSRSFRLPKNIWVAANKIISQVKKRQPKEIDVNGPGGTINHWGVGADTVLDRIPNDDVMVIASTNYQLADIRDKLRSNGISFNYNGSSLSDTRQAKDFYWYHKARKGEPIPLKPAASILRTVGIEGFRVLLDRAREDPYETIPPDRLKEMGLKLTANRTMCDYLAKKPNQVKMNQTLYSMATKFGLESVIEKPKVNLTTYHGSKGKEAKRVILVTDCSPSAMEYNVKNPDYERRLAYVGITRAKEEVHICANQTETYMRTIAGVRTQ